MAVIEKMIAPTVRRVRLAIAKGIVSLVDDSTGYQTLQVRLLNGQVQTSTRFQNYGLTSVPWPGAVHVSAAVGGNQNNLATVAVDDRRYRLKNLQSGDVCLYDSGGNQVYLSPSTGALKVIGITEVDVLAPTVNITASVKVNMTTPLLAVSGDITSGGQVSDVLGSMQGMRNDYNAHSGHTEGVVPTPQMT